MKKVVFVLALAAAMSAVSCVKEQNNVPESSPRVISLTVKATPDTKVALSGWQPVWTGNEKMQVIFGNEGTSDAATTGRVYLDQTSTGIFAGEIEIPTGFNIDDIQGVVVGPDSWYRHLGGQKRIVMPAAADQTQSASGVFEGDNFPFYAEFDSSMLDDDGMGNYTISGLVLSKGFAVIRYNVYGAHDGMLASGESLQSVGLTATGANIVGTTEYNKAGTSAGKPTFNGAGSNSTVSLGTAFPLKGTTVDDGAVIYQAVLARADGSNSSKDASVTKISVVTDKATYTKTLSLTLSPVTGHVYQFNVDLSKDFNREVNVEYSIDGGATWTADIPASFSTLKLRGAMALDEPTLQVVADAVKAQSGNVDVDMSAMKVALTTVDETDLAQFPAVFGNATAADAAANLHSIIFPSNTTAIAAGAFYNCSALESIDLTKISSIGDNAFRATGLKDLVVPETVTTLGNYVFGYCWKLETLYFDSPAHANATGNTHTFSLRNTSAVDALPDSYKKANLIPLIATFGPNAVIGNQEFDTNHKLVKMIFEGKPTIKGNAWVIRCRYIETFDFSKVSSPVAPGANNLGAVGELVTGDKKIIVPKGCAATYYAASTWKQLVDVNGYVIEEQSNVEYSTDGGTTWGSAIPDGAFTTLAVKGNITAATLDEIKTAIETKSTPVAIDLSDSEYESETFPATFKGCTAISHISFPSNVTTAAESAFENCTNLTSVDLDGFTGLTGQYTFCNTGLTSLTIPASISSAIARSFQNCYSLSEIVYAASWNPYSTNASDNYRTFQFGKGNTNNASTVSKTTDLVVTVKSNVKSLPGAAFSSNVNLVKVVFEGDNQVICLRTFQNCHNLATIEMKGDVPPKINATSAYTDVGKNVTAANRKIIIPHGATATYEAHANWAAWETMATALGFTVEEAAE
ncbi:MAG: leucine-rich repeat domain-containing protein [Bacteroidales bacterium]|nr:leucine-rich repeat domain-containing protein [Bacteroidales bacterium]